MNKIKVLAVIETMLVFSTLVAYFATKDRTDFSGFIVAYLIIVMIIIGIPLVSFLIAEYWNEKWMGILFGTIITGVVIYLLFSFLF